MFAVDERLVDLDAPVQKYAPTFAGPGKERVTVRMLLSHDGGLPAWRPFYREASNRAQVMAEADTTSLEYTPGERETYSDIGAIVLTQVVESDLSRTHRLAP